MSALAEKAPFRPRGVIDRRKGLEEASIIEDYVALPDSEKFGSAIETLGSIKLTNDERHSAEIHAGLFATRSSHGDEAITCDEHDFLTGITPDLGIILT